MLEVYSRLFGFCVWHSVFNSWKHTYSPCCELELNLLHLKQWKHLLFSILFIIVYIDIPVCCYTSFTRCRLFYSMHASTCRCWGSGCPNAWQSCLWTSSTGLPCTERQLLSYQDLYKHQWNPSYYTDCSYTMIRSINNRPVHNIYHDNRRSMHLCYRQFSFCIVNINAMMTIIIPYIAS